jgi:hypothetical protein
MTNFTKRQKASAQVNIGKSQAAQSRLPGAMTLGVTNKDRLNLGKAAARNMTQGTMKLNRLPRPPVKKKPIKVARKK